MSNRPGKLIVFYGPMFSGKSNHLIETIDHSNKKKLIFKPKLDTRSINIRSRTGKELPTINIDNSFEILNFIDDKIKEVYIDEINFFDDNLINVVNDLLENYIDVYVSGLDRDYKQDQFNITRELIDMSDFPVQLYARCHKCFKPSIYSVRLKNNELILDENHPQILVDDNSQEIFRYETWCKDCLNKEKRKIRRK